MSTTATPEPIPAERVDLTVEERRDAASAGRLRRRRTLGTAGIGSRPGFLTYGLLAAFVIGGAYPLWWSVVVGSGTNATRGETLPLVPGGNFFANAAKVLDAIPFWLALGNSVLISAIITLSVVTFSTLAGYAFAKLRFRGRDGLMVFVIATMAIPTQLGIIPLFMVMRELGWTGTIGAVIVPTLVTAFGVFFMRQYLVQSLPDELLEAARIDGAGTTRTFLSIVLPTARPGMAVLGMLTFMAAWNDFFWPLIALTSRNPTVQVALNNLGQGYVPDQAVIMAGTLVGTLPVIVVFALLGRQIVSGIMAGAVKG
jgi:cellobiose transport system permease protein